MLEETKDVDVDVDADQELTTLEKIAAAAIFVSLGIRVLWVVGDIVSYARASKEE